MCGLVFGRPNPLIKYYPFCIAFRSRCLGEMTTTWDPALVRGEKGSKGDRVRLISFVSLL